MPHDATYDIGHAEPILPKVQLSSFPSCFPLPATYAILMGDTTDDLRLISRDGWVGNQVALFALLARSLRRQTPLLLLTDPAANWHGHLPSSF